MFAFGDKELGTYVIVTHGIVKKTQKKLPRMRLIEQRGLCLIILTIKTDRYGKDESYTSG